MLSVWLCAGLGAKRWGALMIRIRGRHRSGFEVMVDVPNLEAVDLMVAELQGKGYRPPGTGDATNAVSEGWPLASDAGMRQEPAVERACVTAINAAITAPEHDRVLLGSEVISITEYIRYG